MAKKVWIGERNSSDESRAIRWLRVALLITIPLSLAYEALFSLYTCEQLRIQLGSYRDQDEVWVREFYKTSKNFFVFTVILSTLVFALGMVGVYGRSRLLIGLFLFGFLLEWGFELIGIYCSADWNVIYYKILCEATRPLLFLLALLYAYLISDFAQPAN